MDLLFILILLSGAGCVGLFVYDSWPKKKEEPPEIEMMGGSLNKDLINISVHKWPRDWEMVVRDNTTPELLEEP
jgi:hypothetical protein